MLQLILLSLSPLLLPRANKTTADNLREEWKEKVSFKGRTCKTTIGKIAEQT